jgi:hypothetical protein
MYKPLIKQIALKIILRIKKYFLTHASPNIATSGLPSPVVITNKRVQ